MFEVILLQEHEVMSEASFGQYKSEFISTTEQIKSRIQCEKGGGGEEDVETMLEGTSSVDELLRQGEDLVKQMGLEARGVDDKVVKHDLLEKVKEYKTQLANLRTEYELASLIEVDKDNNSQSSSIVDARSTVRSQNETLIHARGAIADTEAVAMVITEDLSRQRETMKSAHGRVNEVRADAEKGDGILQGMLRRNKFFQGKLW
ncbi:hypothetical protein ACHAWC_002290 [Mediolabrus comicus]